MQKFLKDVLNKLPYIRGLYAREQQYRQNSCFPPGHYYSPIVSVPEAEKQQDRIWKDLQAKELPGIDLQSEHQLKLLAELLPLTAGVPFSAEAGSEFRYYFENEMYSYTDGIVLYALLRYLKPARVIEVGSGFSSALMLDVNQLHFNNGMELHFIEPNPERLYANISERDKDSTGILESKVQDIPPEYFDKLQAGDLLFIDSTHVAKTGSDVNYIFFEILPRLRKGVWIHFHDIFYPFEYPKGWVFGGRNWNENYLLRAFLSNNNDFVIRLFPHYLHLHHPEAFREMPLTYKNKGGNIWIEKITDP